VCSSDLKFKIILSLILILSSVLVITNLNVIQKDGYKDRLPEILNKNLSENTYDLLKNLDGKICFDKIEGCRFGTSSNKKVFIIGDSHMASLIFDLKDKVVKKNYQFITFTFRSCFYFPGFNLIEIKPQNIDKLCNDNLFKKLKQTLLTEKNSIIIFGGRTPVYLSNYSFNNQEGGVEGNEWTSKYVSVGRYDNIQISFQNEISELSKNNKIILIYPIPEVGLDVFNEIFNSIPKTTLRKNYLVPKNYITTSYEVYKNRTKSSFELLDSIQGKNIYRVYPHTLFCDTTIKNRCVTHDEKNIFYADDHHPSIKGSEIINDLIIKEIKMIEFKSR
jgi:hypothetical protein